MKYSNFLILFQIEITCNQEDFENFTGNKWKKLNNEAPYSA